MSILSYFAFFFVLAAICISAPIQDTKSFIDTHWDVIVVGGGPSGLAALSGLARINRKALLIDSGAYRNAPTRQMHDVLGFDGVQPAYFRHAARDQILHYETVTMTNGTVQSIVEDDDPHRNGTLFTVAADLLPPNENQERQEGVYSAQVKPYKLTARKVILATGLVDQLPATPGFNQYWGRGVFWCPWCDGHEAKGQKMGIVAPLSAVPAMVREISTLNNAIKVFVNGTDTEDMREKTTLQEKEDGMPDWEKYLAKKGVAIDNRTISSVALLEGGNISSNSDASLPSNPSHDLFRLEFETGEPVERNALFTAYPTAQRSDLGAHVGVKITTKGKMLADMEKGMQTNVKGIYAVGDANSDDSTNVPHAMWSGKRSAVSTHIALAEEDEIGLLGGARKRAIVDEQSLWDRVNGEAREEALYGGEVDG